MTLQSTDPIADLLTRIRNAVLVGKNKVEVPSSKQKLLIANTLKKAGYLSGVKIEEAKPMSKLIIELAPEGENSTITEISRVSKPGKRVYVKTSEIPKVKNGRGIVLLSTSKGIMTGSEAIKNKLGGELLLKLY